MSLLRIFITSREEDVHASGIFDTDTYEVIIFRGSNMKNRITVEANPYTKQCAEVRNFLFNSGKIKDFEFKEDIKFKNPNIAAGVILGRNADGWARIKKEDGSDLYNYHPKKI